MKSVCWWKQIRNEQAKLVNNFLKKEEVQFHEKRMLKKANKKWTSQVGQLLSQTKEV